uniref:BPTI/Kunitz inhibitor domain-containing protein n=1 Tax=Junco hyemalis TaxID=40217 RepID=A0A8C5NQU2_JUNHY
FRTDLCSAPPVTGPCRAAFPRWFYVPAEKSCREFTYGGCRGNANNHRDERECLRRCRPPGEQTAPKSAKSAQNQPKNQPKSEPKSAQK